MSDNIPEGIKREHVLEALSRYDSGTDHQFAESTVYDILHAGNRYPPKAIIGIAAEILTGTKLGPKDFKGGQESKCFRVLQTNGFQIVPKIGSASSTMWIFQGSPDRYDMDDYLSRYSYIYWRAPRYRTELRVGDQCLIWRSGSIAGAVAIGRIAEAPKSVATVNFPECMGDDLWRKEADLTTTDVVGIQIDEFRLDEDSGFIPRSALLTNATLANATIIKSPQGTIFKLLPAEAVELLSLWHTPLDLSPTALPEALEGAQRLKQHYARERNQTLIRKKKEHFAKSYDGSVFCEVCHFDFANHYPSILGNGFIEVHHLAPLFTQEQSRRTTLDDLLLVCSNCHRMIHRTKSVDGNLNLLRKHFAITPTTSPNPPSPP